MDKLFAQISTALQKGQAPTVTDLVSQALDQGIPAKTILDNALLPAMDIIGEEFKANKIFVPEVLVAARAMNMGAELLKPYLIQDNITPIGTAVIGTVKGDIHDIGKNLVKMMMEAKGIEVIDLGVGVPSDKFISSAKEHNAKVIACSALLTTTMGEMKTIIQLAKAELSGAKVIVGGAPITANYADSIGADGYASDAAAAAELALKLMSS